MTEEYDPESQPDGTFQLAIDADGTCKLERKIKGIWVVLYEADNPMDVMRNIPAVEGESRMTEEPEPTHPRDDEQP